MESGAWMLNFGYGQVAAVGSRELLHLVPSEVLAVPRTPRHCSQVLNWQGRIVPIWDVLAWLTDGSQMGDGRLAAVVGYQSRRRQTPRFGALLLVEPPSRIVVTDDQACEPPPEQTRWQAVASACFQREGQPVVVLDLPLIFSDAFAGRHT